MSLTNKQILNMLKSGAWTVRDISRRFGIEERKIRGIVENDRVWDGWVGDDFSRGRVGPFHGNAGYPSEAD